MRYTTLGNTDIEISPIILGCWAFGGGYTWGDQDDDASVRTVDVALDNGINCFDTAEFYGQGHSETVLGRALKGKRSSAIVISKPWIENMEAEGIKRACEGSLKRLGTDYIDIYMIHWPNRSVALSSTLEAMSALKESGKIRALGVCNFGELDLEEACDIADIVADQLPYNLLFRAIEFEVLPAARKRKLSVLAYSTLGQGLLTGKYLRPEDVDDERARIRFYSKARPGTVHEEDGHEAEVFEAVGRLKRICDEAEIALSHAAISWVLAQDGISAALVGARTPEQVQGNLGSLERRLERGVAEALEAATADLKAALGPNPDMWRSESRYR